MSFPRNTDVSRHLARKHRRPANPPLKSAPAADRANTELQSLTEDLAAAVNSAQSSARNSAKLVGNR